MSTAAAKNPPRYELEDHDTRMRIMGEMLVHGASRVDLQQFAMQRWQVSGRTAELYVQTVRRKLAGEAGAEDRLFYLRLSQLQRDHLVGLALRYTFKENYDPHVMQSLASMITAVRGLLESRDRTAAEIHRLVEDKLGQGEALVSAPDAPPAEDAAESCAAEPTPSAAEANGHASESKQARAKRPRTAGGDEGHAEAADANGMTTPPSRNGDKGHETAAESRLRFNGDSELEQEPDARAREALACAGCAGGI